MNESDQQEWQRQDERYYKSWAVANRLYYAYLDGYLTSEEFEFILEKFGILIDERQPQGQP